MVERFDGRVQREVLGITVAGHRDLERLLEGFNQAYNARRQRVLDGRSPEEVGRERLAQDRGLANPGYRPPFDPCALPRAMLVIERAKDVSQPDSYRDALDPNRRGHCLINWCNLRRPTTDPRPAYPGNDVVDIIGMDMHGNARDIGYPTSEAEFIDQCLTRRGPGGSPWSVIAWQTFARNHGKPIAIDESGATNPQGPHRPADWATWVRGMFDFYQENHGAGPGQLLYEIYFNRIRDYAAGNGAHVVPTDVNPDASAAYRRLYHP